MATGASRAVRLEDVAVCVEGIRCEILSIGPPAIPEPQEVDKVPTRKELVEASLHDLALTGHLSGHSPSEVDKGEEDLQHEGRSEEP